MTNPTNRPASLAAGPLFNEPVSENGYLWFYIDALSDDGKYALTIIAFVGCVFSPFYANARRQNSPNRVDPMKHCAINVALYTVADGQQVNRQAAHQWVLTECDGLGGLGQKSRLVERDATRFKVSNTTLQWDGQQLTIDIDELNIPFPAPAFMQAPFAKPLRGKVVVTPLTMFTDSYPLDAQHRHQWRPIAPLARVEVQMSSPALSWQGAAYWDSNYGSEPLETAFTAWDWSRTKPANNGDSTLIVYDLTRTDGTNFKLAKRFSADASGAHVHDVAPPPPATLSRSGWGITRRTVCDEGAKPVVIKTAEDTPFYARSIVNTQINGASVTMFHESLSMKRFSTRWVQMLLPFKIRRS